jgi:diadenylate cyclase
VSELLWYLQRLSWIDVLDIFLVGLIFFLILYLLRGTRAVPLLRGVIFLTIAITLLSSVIQLRAFSWLAGNVLPALLVAIPVVFQPELRRALERLGRAGALLGRGTGKPAAVQQMLAEIARACRTLSERRHGALIVLEFETGLQEFIDTGVQVSGEVSSELLVTIFDPHTPLHDGAVIVRETLVAAAACVLPLSSAFLADRQLGLRHRAGLGITEESDAVAIVVSEERGSISICHNGRIFRNVDFRRLENLLHAFFQPALERAWPRWVANVRQFLGGEK